MRCISAFLKSDKGATAVEYALMVSGIAAVVCVVAALLGTNVLRLFQSAITGW